MLNEALRLIRVYHDMTQKDVAARVGLSKSYVSDLEAGNKKVTLEVLEKYSHAFNIPASSLMLFAERAAKRDFAEDARVYIAGKALKMLDWIAAIVADKARNEKASDD